MDVAESFANKNEADMLAAVLYGRAHTWILLEDENELKAFYQRWAPFRPEVL